jgi:hypothetical protein
MAAPPIILGRSYTNFNLIGNCKSLLTYSVLFNKKIGIINKIYINNKATMENEFLGTRSMSVKSGYEYIPTYFSSNQGNLNPDFLSVGFVSMRVPSFFNSVAKSIF